MPKKILLLCGFTILISAACHKAVPVTAKSVPTPPSPQAAPGPPPRPAVAASRPVAQTPTAQQASPRPATMTAQERETLNQRLAHLSDALFDYDKANIRPDALTTLSSDVNVVKGILSNYPAQKLLVVGGADERGSAEYNLALGDRRAKAA